MVVQPFGVQLPLNLGPPILPYAPQGAPAPSHSLSVEPEPSHHPGPDLSPTMGPPCQCCQMLEGRLPVRLGFCSWD